MTAFADLEKPSAIVRVHHYEHPPGERHFQAWFVCPGCKDHHAWDDSWKFNGDWEKPTIEPSFLTWLDANPKAMSEPYISGRRCHSYIRDGNIQFLSDCTHELAGKTVPIPEWQDTVR